jgi:hypothetical protein
LTPYPNPAQFAVGNPVDGGVVGGLVHDNLNQIGFDTQPSNKPLAPLGGIIAEQPDFVERLRGQQRPGRAEISVLGQDAAELRHQGFASGRGQRGGHRPKIAVANPLQEDFSFRHRRKSVLK